MSQERKQVISLFLPFLKAAHDKFPKISFMPERISFASKDILTSAELRRQKEYKAGLKL